MEAEFEIGTTPPIDDPDFESFWERFLQDSKEATGSRSATRDHPRKAILDAYGECFATMDLLHETAREAINWASVTVHESLSDSSDDDAFADYINVLVGLGGRALLAFDEVTWLLRGGYPHGAITRMRTIHEVFVVAATLGLHGYPDGDHPELVERYQRSRSRGIGRSSGTTSPPTWGRSGSISSPPPASAPTTANSKRAVGKTPTGRVSRCRRTASTRCTSSSARSWTPRSMTD